MLRRQYEASEHVTTPHAVERVVGLLERHGLDVPRKVAPRRVFEDGGHVVERPPNRRCKSSFVRDAAERELERSRRLSQLDNDALASD